jgi:hypothetical protein
LASTRTGRCGSSPRTCTRSASPPSSCEPDVYGVAKRKRNVKQKNETRSIKSKDCFDLLSKKNFAACRLHPQPITARVRATRTPPSGTSWLAAGRVPSARLPSCTRDSKVTKVRFAGPHSPDLLPSSSNTRPCMTRTDACNGVAPQPVVGS